MLARVYPEVVRKFKEAISNANAILIATPEYNGAVPDPQVLVPQASRLFDEQVSVRDQETRQEIRQLIEAVAQ